MQELTAAGLRSVPAVRKGSKFAYAQSLDDVANLLGAFVISRAHTLIYP